MEDRRNTHRILVGIPKRKDLLGELGIEGRTILTQNRS
jgi:hypothetical protein